MKVKFLKYLSPLLDQALVSGGSFLTIAISARFLSIDEQGKLGYVIAAYLGVVVINTTVLFQWANVQVARVTDQENYRRELAIFQILVGFFSSVAVSVIVVLLGKRSGWNVTEVDFVPIFAFLLFQQLADFDRRTSYIFFSAVRAVKTSVVVYLPRIALLVVVGPSDIVEILRLMILTALIPALKVVKLSLYGSFTFAQVITFIRTQPAGAKWLMVSGPLVWAVATLPVYFLGAISGMTAVGVFITVRSLTNTMNVAMELLETEVSARAGRLYGVQQKGFVLLFRKVKFIGYILWSICAGLLYVWGSEALKQIYGESYFGYRDLLLLLWLSTGITFMFRVNAVELRSAGKGRTVSLAYFMAIIVMVMAAYPLITKFDVMGAAILVCLGVSTNYLVQISINYFENLVKL